MPSPSTLPSELVLAVLGHVQADPATLRACALVSRAWRGPAQATLHETLTLTSQAKLDAWLAYNSGGGFWTDRVELKAGPGGRRQAAAAVGRVRGTRALTLEVERARFGVDLLEHDELRRLSSLSLATSFADPPADRAIRLPFSLSSLLLTGSYSSYPLELVAALASSPLASLSLACYGPGSVPFLSALAPTFPSLRHLHLSAAASGPALVALLPLLASAAALESFTCFEPTPALLAALPASVTLVAFTKDYIRPTGAEPTYADVIHDAGLLARPALRAVRFARISRTTLRNQRGGPELLAACGRKAVRVEFGADAVGTFGIRRGDVDKARGAWAEERALV